RGRGRRRARGIERLVDRALPASADPDRGRRAGPLKASLSLCARLQARAQNRTEQLVCADRDAVSDFAVRPLAALSQALSRDVVATLEAAAEIAAAGLRGRPDPCGGFSPQVEGDRNAVRAVFRRGERPCLDRLRAAR